MSMNLTSTDRLRNTLNEQYLALHPTSLFQSTWRPLNMSSHLRQRARQPGQRPRRCHEVFSAHIPSTQPRRSRKEKRAASYSASRSMPPVESLRYQSTVRAAAVRSMRLPQKRSASGGLTRQQTMAHQSLARYGFLSVFASNPSGRQLYRQSGIASLADATWYLPAPS